MRRLIEDAIESLILLLDEIDGDDELEIDTDREHDQAEDGFGDSDGVYEQLMRAADVHRGGAPLLREADAPTSNPS
jgi:hypothetical protein